MHFRNLNKDSSILIQRAHLDNYMRNLRIINDVSRRIKLYLTPEEILPSIINPLSNPAPTL